MGDVDANVWAAAAGRYAPTPSGDLHIGNLRTALVAWLAARSTARRFVLRVDDLDPDRSRDDAIPRQLSDLAAIGVDSDDPGAGQPPYRESEHTASYAAALDSLNARGLVYECFCTRHEILGAPSAPHASQGMYPGTCRNLTSVQREERRAARPHPALRLASDHSVVHIHDEIHGSVSGVADDVVLRRGDGVYAYNLAVVVDDAAQGVDQVVRGDDLLSSAPRQAYLARLLGLPTVSYAHVPLVLAPSGARLAKRDGAVTLAKLRGAGVDATAVTRLLLTSLGLPGDLGRSLAAFSFDALPHEPWVFDSAELVGS